MAASPRCERPRATRQTVLLGLFGLALSCSEVSAVEPAPRYTVTGFGTLSFDPPAQKDGRLQLEASLSPLAAQSAPESTDRFFLTGTLSSTSLVCYYDTIFRDSFDGNGL